MNFRFLVIFKKSLESFYYYYLLLELTTLGLSNDVMAILSLRANSGKVKFMVYSPKFAAYYHNLLTLRKYHVVLILISIVVLGVGIDFMVNIK